MVTSCNSIWLLTNLFLWAALIFAGIETAVTLRIKWETWKRTPHPQSQGVAADPGDWSKLFEALTKLLLALKELPAWVAIFLAGLALLWSSTSVSHLCST